MFYVTRETVGGDDELVFACDEIGTRGKTLTAVRWPRRNGAEEFTGAFWDQPRNERVTRIVARWFDGKKRKAVAKRPEGI